MNTLRIVSLETLLYLYYKEANMMLILANPRCWKIKWVHFIIIFFNFKIESCFFIENSPFYLLMKFLHLH